MKTKNPISNFPAGIAILTGMDFNAAWDFAMDVVDYPVEILPMYVDSPVDGYMLASGETNTGRVSTFYGVTVDRNRDGTDSVIAAVTDTYGTLSSVDVYRDLMADLAAANIDHHVQSVYVSGNGGTQVLGVRVKNVTDGQNNIRMLLSLQTSVDGTKKHQMRLSAWDMVNECEILGISGSSMTVSSRHTKTIGERHAAFLTILTTMVKEWETTIIPMMTIMNDMKFDYSFALDLVREILEGAEIPERHVDNAVADIGYSKEEKLSMIDVLTGVSVYMNDALGTKQERLGAFREKINKQVRKTFSKLAPK